jgi:hypothetical protein
LLFAGQNVWNNAQPIFNQLVSDLTNHAGDAVTIVAQSIAQLNGVIGSSGKREAKAGVTDFIINTFGLSGVWDTIVNLGAGVVLQFTGIATQLLFAGQNIWTAAQPIFNQLVSDLTNHVGSTPIIVAQAVATLNSLLAASGKREAKNAVLDFILNAFNISGVWGTISALGGSVVAQFTGIASQLLFAGQNVWNNAQPIFNQLVSDLTNHAGDAVTIVAQAIAQLNGVVGSAGKRELIQRDLLSNIVSALGLGAVWDTITALGSSVVLQFIQIGTEFLFAGQQIKVQAQAILSQLITDLLSHTGNASSIVAQAVGQLNTILGSSGKRDLTSTIVSSLGLDQVWSTITSLGASTYLQFVQIGTSLLFAGQQVWAQAQVVLAQLKNDLLNHTGDAVSIVAQSITSLNQIIGLML